MSQINHLVLGLAQSDHFRFILGVFIPSGFLFGHSVDLQRQEHTSTQILIVECGRERLQNLVLLLGCVIHDQSFEGFPLQTQESGYGGCHMLLFRLFAVLACLSQIQKPSTLNLKFFKFDRSMLLEFFSGVQPQTVKCFPLQSQVNSV